MNIVVCDDEKLARDRLVRLLLALGHTIVAEASNGIEALAAVKQFQPDVIILDIQMPQQDGLSCAMHISSLATPPAIIFCTAFDQYAIDAFQTHAIAYLLKPISQSDLANALQKATKLTQAQLRAFAPSEQHTAATKTRQHITARTYRGVELIPIDEIYYFLADQKYVMVRHKHGQVLIDETLKELETEFGNQFIRIHRNALLSLKYLDGLELLSNGQYQARCREIDQKLMISRRHLAHIKERMQHL